MASHLDWSAYETNNDFSFGMGDTLGLPAQPGSGFRNAVGTCTGRQHCHSLEPGLLCPSFRATRDEVHATYHRASTLQAALDGRLGDNAFSAPALTEALDLCVGCKGCKRECPNGVDMALLSVEAKARRWAEAGEVPRRVQLFAHLPRMASHLARWRMLIRLAMMVPGASWLAEQLLGISARRQIPVPAARSFLGSRSDSAVGSGEAGEVVLLADTFTNHFEPHIAQAALAVLAAAGYRVHLARPSDAGRPLCCGRTFLSQGLVHEARVEALRTVESLFPYVEQGMTIIGLEPSCLLMLRDEYRALGLGDRIAQIAGAALLFEEFILRENRSRGFRLKLKPIASQALVHGHCHQKVFNAMQAMIEILGWIPGLNVRQIESSCCGMAGAFGYEAEHYKASMAMAELDLLPAVRNAAEGTLLVANGTSCRHQIDDGTGRHAFHLAEVLQFALIDRARG